MNFLKFSILLTFLLQIFNYPIFCHGRVPTNRRLKILVYSPSLSWSHAQFLGKIADTLQEAGHEVHYLKYVFDQQILHGRNETSRVDRIHLVQSQNVIWQGMTKDRTAFIKNSFEGDWPMLNFFNHPFRLFAPFATVICQDMIENTELLNRMTTEKFDVAIAEIYDLCPLAIFHRIGVCTMLGASAVPMTQKMGRRFGIPTFASFVPNLVISSGKPLESSFFHRLLNFYNEFYDWAWMDDATVRMQEPLIRKAFGPDFPALKELAKNVSLLFTNSNPFLETKRPISNKIVHIGGIVNNGNEKALDQKFLQILQNANGGAVLFSFGSIADPKFMSAQMRRAILRAFGHFPTVQFLWKVDSAWLLNDSADSELFLTLDNVHTFEWIPQTALLKHPNLCAFISHCGQNSLSEAAWAGVPIVGIPLFGDQLYNAAVASRHGIALQLDVRQLNGPNAEQILVEAIGEILNNPLYRLNAQRISKKLTQTPFSPAERLVRWTEFAAGFGPLNELNLPTDIHWFIYYSLDVILFTAGMFCCVILVAGKCAIVLVEKLFGKRNLLKMENGVQKLKRN